MNTEEDFWVCVNISNLDNCWLWLKSHKKGLEYGTLKYNGESHIAHRVAYCIYHKLNLVDIRGLMVMHTCDNPPCCNPHHLVLGDAKSNSRDMAQKERNWKAVGVDNHFSLLNDNNVREIRRLFLTNTYSQTQLSYMFNVSISTIHMIVRLKTWKHVL